MAFPYNKPSPVAQVWADQDPAEGHSLWFHPVHEWPTEDRREAVQWAQETNIKPMHKWILS